MNIEDEYIELILENKQRLGSWAYELINDAESSFDKENTTEYPENLYKALFRLRNQKDDIPLLYGLDDYINRLRTKWRTNLTSKDITNIGSLAYFFSHYMKVFRRSVRLPEGTSFTYKEKQENSPSALIEKIVEDAIGRLFKLHDTFAPTRPGTVNINIDSSDTAEMKLIKRRGEQEYAPKIVTYYQSYGVSIGLLPNAEYKRNRYIFYMKLLPRTDIKLICRYAEEVKRLFGIEVFIPDIHSTPMKLIVSEKPLEENSLTKILESSEFKDSKMEIPYAVGYDATGEMAVADVVEFPHLLVGGTSKSGKSSALHSLLMSIVYSQPAEKVKLLLLDFGASGIKMFDKTPHVLCPTIAENEIEKGRKWILWLQKEMVRRLNWKNSVDERTFARKSQTLPYIVCVIDEFPTFISRLTEGRGNKESYKIIEDLLARARKVKIHLISAAQDATKSDMGIKNTNLAAGIAFQCTNWYTSKAVIGEPDAVHLSGKGSMYFKYEGDLKRLQGSFMLPVEIEEELEKMGFSHDSKYDEIKLELSSPSVDVPAHTSASPAVTYDTDEGILVEIIKLIVDEKLDKISNRELKNRFHRSYDIAERYMQQLQDLGIIAELRPGTKTKRTVYLDKANEYLQSIEQSHEVHNQLSPESSVSSDTETERMSTEYITNEIRTVQKKSESNTDDTKRMKKSLSKFMDNHGSDRYKFGNRKSKKGTTR